MKDGNGLKLLTGIFTKNLVLKFKPEKTKSGERPDVSEMIKFALEERTKNPITYDFKISVELEKTYEGVENLGTKADVVFVSKEFSAKFGCETGEEMVKKFRNGLFFRILNKSIFFNCENIGERAIS